MGGVHKKLNYNVVVKISTSEVTIKNDRKNWKWGVKPLGCWLAFGCPPALRNRLKQAFASFCFFSDKNDEKKLKKMSENVWKCQTKSLRKTFGCTQLPRAGQITQERGFLFMNKSGIKNYQSVNTIYLKWLHWLSKKQGCIIFIFIPLWAKRVGR